MLQSERELSNVEPRPILAEPSFLLQMPEQLASTLVVGDEIQLLLRLERKLEADEEWAFKTALQDFALADSVCDLLLGDNLLLGQHFHGVNTAGVLLSDLEHTTEGTATDELEELEVCGPQVCLGLGPSARARPRQRDGDIPEERYKPPVSITLP